jgi:hypothetical protein
VARGLTDMEACANQPQRASATTQMSSDTFASTTLEPARAQPAERAAFCSPGWRRARAKPGASGTLGIPRHDVEPAERAALTAQCARREPPAPRAPAKFRPFPRVPFAVRCAPRSSAPWATKSRPLRGLCARGPHSGGCERRLCVYRCQYPQGLANVPCPQAAPAWLLGPYRQVASARLFAPCCHAA